MKIKTVGYVLKGKKGYVTQGDKSRRMNVMDLFGEHLPITGKEIESNVGVKPSGDKVWADEDGNPSLIPIVGQPSFKGSIDVAGGKANLVSIQKEDDRGNWDAQNFATIKNGYWVIHKGKYHAIYEVFG